MATRRISRTLTGWILIIALLLLAGTCTAGIGTSNRLQCPKLTLKLRLEYALTIPTAQLTPITTLKNSSKESKSWVPRIIIPVAIVVITATATYLIFSQRGG